MVMINWIAGYPGQAQKVTSTMRSFDSNGSSSLTKIHSQPGYSDKFGESSYSAARADDPPYFAGAGNVGQPSTINYRIANVSGADYEKLSSQQALKRTLPSSLQASEPNNKSNSVYSNGPRDIYGNAHHLAGPSVTNSRGYSRDPYSKGNNDDIIMYENNGSRILPPSFVHGKSSAQFPGSSEPMYHSMNGEERGAETDERLIYQAALEVFLQLIFP